MVQENLDTLYGAVDDGAAKLGLPPFVRKELAVDLDPLSLLTRLCASVPPPCLAP